MHSVQKTTILAEMFSKNLSLSESDQPLPFTPRASCTMPEVHTRTVKVKRELANLVMEFILNHKLMKYLEDNSLLNDRQYGFRKNRSTGDLMALMTETWNRSVHFFGEIKVVALDISKAFDRVWHQGLISKLKSYGVGNTFIRWLSDFLCNRSIRVVIDWINSNLYILMKLA